MERPFFTAAGGPETLRWLSIAEKLLSARDLLGSKSFATRARDADSTLSSADEILAVVDTLLAGERRIGNNQPDFYSILRLTPTQGGDSDLVAEQYRRLVDLLNPQKNRLPFAEQAFRLVIDAWSVLSNPSRKSLYDKELGFENFVFAQSDKQLRGGESNNSSGRNHRPQPPQMHAQPRAGSVFGGPNPESQNFTGFHSGSNIAFGSKHDPQPVINNKEKQSQQDYSNDGVGGISSDHIVSENPEETEAVEDEGNDNRTIEKEQEVVVEEKDDSPKNDNVMSFWTACPYCYYMYEYPMDYVDCTMRCQNCKSAFQAVVIPSPPPVVEGQDAYFCCWGFLPLGLSMDILKKNPVSAPKKTGYARQKPSVPRVYIDEDADIFAGISSSSESDVDWQEEKDRKRKKTSQKMGRRRTNSGLKPTRPLKKAVANKGKNNADTQDDPVYASATAVDVGNVEGGGASGRKQPNRVAKNFNKLDLNVELSNEADEVSVNLNTGSEPGRREDDNINMEGIGFFDGLDELFSNLPILKAT